jgi:hypothetical protein
MNDSNSYSERIIAEVSAWPEVETGPGRRGSSMAFSVRGREIGHLHGDHAAHFGFPKDVWDELMREGRIVVHPIFPDSRGPAARRIDGAEDVREVIELLRLNYDRVVASEGLADTA